MTRTYCYELWNGKEVIGRVTLMYPIKGKSVTFPTVSVLKALFRRKYETITLPIAYCSISDDGVDYVVRRRLDVRRKSKRQIELVKEFA